jgi:hypothetical protein
MSPDQQIEQEIQTQGATEPDCVGVELPQYQCHKRVRAAKITALRQNGNHDMPDLVLGEIGCVVTHLPDWHLKHKPEVGGYYVVYEDGYASYSPARAFEDGYTRI